MWYRDDRTENEKYLEQQLEQERRWRDEEQERQQQERERRRQERREAYEWELREANDWLDAIGKQRLLCSRESHLDDDVVGYFFTSSAEACDYALEIWPEEAGKVEAEIQRLEAEIERLRNSVRLAVGQRLAEHERAKQEGWRDVAVTLQDADADASAWLNW